MCVSVYVGVCGVYKNVKIKRLKGDNIFYCVCECVCRGVWCEMWKRNNMWNELKRKEVLYSVVGGVGVFWEEWGIFFKKIEVEWGDKWEGNSQRKKCYKQKSQKSKVKNGSIKDADADADEGEGGLLGEEQ